VLPVTRWNALLVFLLIACALGVVTSQHKARKLFAEMEKEQALAKRMQEEWGQLQLEQSTWAMPARVEKIASKQLQMRRPGAVQVERVPSKVGETGRAKSATD